MHNSKRKIFSLFVYCDHERTLFRCIKHYGLFDAHFTVHQQIKELFYEWTRVFTYLGIDLCL